LNAGWRWLVVVLALGIASSAEAQLAPAVAPAVGTETAVRPEVMQRVVRSLFVIEGEAPVSFFAALGAEGRGALLSIVRDPARAVGLRRRAVLALHHYPDAGVRAELEARAASASEDALLSRYALRTLAAAFGVVAFDAVRAGLDDERAMVREGAALALSSLDATRARSFLAARLGVEHELFVRETLTALLR
jgi:hypothetical protein